MNAVSRKRAVSMDSIHEQRLANFVKLIETRFGGNGSKMAKKLRRSHTLVWQLINRRRQMGEETARYIEQCLGLADGTMDSGHVRQATELMVVLDDGTHQTFHLVPVVEFSLGLNKKKVPSEFRPGPVNCSGGTVAVIQESDSLEPRVRKGADVFVDKKKREVVDDGVYAIEVRGMKEPVLRVARKRDGGGFTFITLKN